MAAPPDSEDVRVSHALWGGRSLPDVDGPRGLTPAEFNQAQTPMSTVQFDLWFSGLIANMNLTDPRQIREKRQLFRTMQRRAHAKARANAAPGEADAKAPPVHKAFDQMSNVEFGQWVRENVKLLTPDEIERAKQRFEANQAAKAAQAAQATKAAAATTGASEEQWSMYRRRQNQGAAPLGPARPWGPLPGPMAAAKAAEAAPPSSCYDVQKQSDPTECNKDLSCQYDMTQRLCLPKHIIKNRAMRASWWLSGAKDDERLAVKAATDGLIKQWEHFQCWLSTTPWDCNSQSGCKYFSIMNKCLPEEAAPHAGHLMNTETLRQYLKQHKLHATKANTGMMSRTQIAKVAAISGLLGITAFGGMNSLASFLIAAARLGFATISAFVRSIGSVITFVRAAVQQAQALPSVFTQLSAEITQATAPIVATANTTLASVNTTFSPYLTSASSAAATTTSPVVGAASAAASAASAAAASLVSILATVASGGLATLAALIAMEAVPTATRVAASLKEALGLVGKEVQKEIGELRAQVQSLEVELERDKRIMSNARRRRLTITLRGARTKLQGSIRKAVGHGLWAVIAMSVCGGLALLTASVGVGALLASVQFTVSMIVIGADFMGMNRLFSPATVLRWLVSKAPWRRLGSFFGKIFKRKYRGRSDPQLAAQIKAVGVVVNQG